MLLEEDVEEQKSVIGQELEDLVLDPPNWMTEMLHRVAFGGQGKGLQQICPPHNLSNLNGQVLRDFVNTYYTYVALPIIYLHAIYYTVCRVRGLSRVSLTLTFPHTESRTS